MTTLPPMSTLTDTRFPYTALCPAFTRDDPRILDMHYGLPFIEVLARPLLTPVRVGNWPVEFRVFFGGAADEAAAISFYYPKADEFEITPALESAAEQARTWGKAMYVEPQTQTGIAS